MSRRQTRLTGFHPVIIFMRDRFRIIFPETGPGASLEQWTRIFQ